ncbi:tetratricopeptide repeat protein [Microbacterium panaciterrae]|uniref:Tetratricopeptide repeat protein n=1 Tax=Microbacterium panaciterrae TaxID=985759 RepID=A0ABP8PAU6_9MICO
MTDDALASAWADVGSEDRERIGRALDAFRALIPRAVMTEGEGGPTHRSALRGLAYGLDELERTAEAREMYRTLAEVCETALADRAHLDASREQLIDDRLYARAAERIVGQDPDTVPPAVIADLDALIAEGEQQLGVAHGRVLWLLERRALWLTRRDTDEGLRAYDLLIARAAADQEGGGNHLMALAAKARELSRLDEDDVSALLWGHVLDGRRVLLGLDHPATLDAWWWRARTRFWSSDAIGAEADLALLVPALGRVRGEDDPLTLETMRFRVSVLRLLARSGAPAEDPLPLLRRITVLETARFGPTSRQVLNTRMVAVEVQLDGSDRAGRRGLVDEARAIVDDAAEHGPLDRVALRSRNLEARVLLDASAADRSAALADLARARAAERCAAIDDACAQRASARADDGHGGEGARASDDELFGELRRAWADRASGFDPLSADALDLLRAGADRLRSYGGDARRHEIGVRDELGARLRDAGRGEEALADYQRSLELEHALADESETPDERRGAATRIAQSRQAIGVTLRGLGRTAEGEETLSRAIADAERDGATRSAIDGLRNSRALALQELGRTDEACAEMRALYDASGDVHRAIDLAAVYLNSDRPAEAEALLRPVLEALEAEGAGESVPALRVLGNLALAACQLDRDAEAAASYDRLYEVQVRVLGPEHRDTLITLHNRALEERHLGRPAESARRFEHALEHRTAALGARDPHTLSTLAALAGAVQDGGDLPRARLLAEQAVTLSTEVLGPTHPLTLHRIRDLDGILAALGREEGERETLASATRADFAAEAPSGAEGETAGRQNSLRARASKTRSALIGGVVVALIIGYLIWSRMS